MMLIGMDSAGVGAARASRTTEAARQEHESHLREAGRSAAGSTAPSGQGGFIKHNYTQDDYKRMVVNLDDEEDN